MTGHILSGIVMLLATAAGGFAHEEAPVAAIGFDEKLGSYLPLDASFSGEDGAAVRLSELVKGPTILALAYFRCKNECNTLLTGLAAGLRSLPAGPGEDFRLLTVSINELETPRDALEKKALALAAIEKPFPAERWSFLVGDEPNIRRLADSVGFKFTRRGEDFDHPLGLIIVAPDGKLVRYINGTEFLPMELRMSLLEASSGLVGPTVAKLLRFCFNYDPHARRYGFNLLAVSSTVILALVGAFATFLVLAGRKRRLAQGRKS